MNTARPRSYRLPLVEGFSNAGVARFDAALTESAERLIDLVHALDSQQLCYAPEPANIAIAQLVKHMAWGECQWVAKISGVAVPDALQQKLEGGSPADFIGTVVSGVTADDLCDLIRESRFDYARESLKRVVDLNQKTGAALGPATVNEVLMHLTWHWAYHSGQVGLLRDFVGAEYSWCFEQNNGK